MDGKLDGWIPSPSSQKGQRAAREGPKLVNPGATRGDADCAGFERGLRPPV